jgi:hypothetical protein
VASKHLRRRGDSQHSDNRSTREKMSRFHFLSPGLPRPIRDLQEDYDPPHRKLPCTLKKISFYLFWPTADDTARGSDGVVPSCFD